MQAAPLVRGHEVVIGLEPHVPLLTHSKAFSGASTAFGAPPNTQASAVDLALPGTLPVLNRSAVECAIRFGLAVGARIATQSIFARKNYFYPDLPKGYQISQYERPLALGGGLEVSSGGKTTFIALTRIHMEEDAGKSLHEGFFDSDRRTYIDYNRSGVPLIEIVSEPDMRSAAEGAEFFSRLRDILVWLGVNDGNMEEGSLRCDANVSVRRRGEPRFGT
jgi:aspartyl-tRNA(Asn)/glutamyl-tRNA(Gln) amidotransferase subunit B